MTEQTNDIAFCKEFEKQTLEGLVKHSRLERWVPGFTDEVTDFDHTQRYEWVTGFVNDKIVLDVACGAGKGSHLLATKGRAKQVLGCDLDKDAIRYASVKYKAPNLRYEVQDAQALEMDSVYDVVVSFETIEHLKNTNQFLNSVAKAMKADGRFFVSTPVSQYEEDLRPHNPFHVKEWGYYNFQKLIAEQFKIDRIFIQLHEKRPYSFPERLLDKLCHREINPANTILVEYNNQVPVSKFGKQYTGYQILVCSKKT